MSKRAFFTILLLIAIVVSVAGVAPQAAAQSDVFRVAAVSPSATNDLAFSQSMYDALLAVQEEMGEDAFQFVFQEGTFIVDDAAVALREWAASGEFDLVIAHGSQYGSIIEDLAPEFPEVAFAWGTDVNTFGLDNVFAYSAASEEGGYINGVIAAMLTQTGTIGVIGPIEVGDAKLYVDGFRAGVAATNPDARLLVTYIGSFSDVPLATEAAETHRANGADVLTGTAQMVIGPIAVAKENGLLWFGTQASQAGIAEESGVLFQVYHWEVVLMDIIERVREGELGGIAYTVTLENGGLVMEYSELTGLSEEQMEMIEETVNALVEQISAGEIEVLPTPESGS
jgi:basic membrane lipoprotein Med (substrate-binding protein (PBP1-ABC) superfamily)